MRKTAATILILGAAWIGYTAWPVYDLLVLVRAIETRHVDTLTRHVYFDAVRASLTNQIVAAYVQTPESRSVHSHNAWPPLLSPIQSRKN